MSDTPFLTVADVARLVVMTEPYVRDKLISRSSISKIRHGKAWARV